MRTPVATAAPFAALIAATLAFRAPALWNAAGVHSDAAIIGLQAMHGLRGEWGRFVWGTDYQGVVDVAAVAVLFALAGATPRALMLAPLAGHVLLTWLAYRTLRRHLAPWAAAAACAPLVLTPMAISGVALYAPRQYCVTVLFAAIWLVDGAGTAARPHLRLFAAPILAALAVYSDLYALQLVPAVAGFALLCCLDGRPTAAAVARRAGAFASGAALGMAMLALARRGVVPRPGPMLSLEHVPRNWPLLRDVCLPWVLGARAYVPGASLWPAPWDAPRLVRGLQAAGAASLLVAIATAPLFALRREVPWPLRRLAVLAFAATGSSLMGFLLSGSPTDLWSARYLAPIVWTSPFALALFASLLGTARFALSSTPYLCVAALGGWLAYGAYARGPFPRSDERGQASEERTLGEALRARGVHHGLAQYWLSYRLTFLWREDPVLVPLDPREDRYAPYRAAVEGARSIAYVFHPSEPRARAEDVEPGLRAAGGRVERFELAGFTVLVHEK